MQQTRIGSLNESLIGILIGYVVALLSQVIIFPMYDMNVPLTTNLWIGAWFTLISLVRNYAVRRWFNAKLHNEVMTPEKKSN